MRIMIFRLAGAAGLATMAVAASAQDTAPAIPAAQVQQLVETLKQRNDQLRELSARVNELEARAARADAAVARLDAAEKGLLLAAQKNRELAALGEAIIVDYEKMDLGKRVAAGEPLTQLYRVRLQNKLQEYQDQIAQLGFYPERDAQVPTAAAPQANP